MHNMGEAVGKFKNKWNNKYPDIVYNTEKKAASLGSMITWQA